MLRRSLVIALALLSTAAQANWYRGNTHTHTLNSDGDAAPDSVVRWYREHGYQFLFITDHEFITEPAPLNALLGAPERFLVLPGEEVTQWGADPKRRSAHLNALFARQVVFPLGEGECSGGACGATVAASVDLKTTINTNIAAIRSAGGIVQINHPNWLWSLRPDDLADVPDRTLLEVWNGQHVNNLGGADERGNVAPSTETIWDQLLSSGKIIWGVASDDSHNYHDLENRESSRPGKGWIAVRAAELTSQSIETALRNGEFYASTGVALTRIDSVAATLTISIETADDARYSTRFTGVNGRLLAEIAGVTATYRAKPGDVYVRATVTDSNGLRAWTQPVFLDGRGRAR